MKQLLVISGKGGTGKTTLVSSFAALAGSKIVSDCDVDAADLHLILDPEIETREEFSGAKEAVKDDDKCTNCGLCYEHCRFDAIDEDFEVDPFRCEGCGVCAYVCPEDAIEMEDVLSGYLLVSKTIYGGMVHGELRPGEETSGLLVTEVKKRAQDLAEEEKKGLIIIDGSPGTGCPVIASLSNVDLALIVTEPTLSGLSDLKRVLELSQNFEIELAIVINKYDLNREMVKKIEDYAEGKDVPVVGKIPYDLKVTEAMIGGKSVVEYLDNDTTDEIENIWKNLYRKIRPDAVRD